MKHLILYLPAQISSKDDHRVTSIKEIISQPSCTCRGLFQIYLQICLLPIYKESFQWKNIRYGEGMYRRSLLLCVCVCVCVCIQLLSWVWLFATPWTEACQAPQSMGFSRQKYWNGLPFPSPGDLSDPGIKAESPPSPELGDGFLSTSTTVWPSANHWGLLGHTGVWTQVLWKELGTNKYNTSTLCKSTI